MQETFFINSCTPICRNYRELIFTATIVPEFSAFHSTLSTTAAIHLNGTIIECDGSGIQAERHHIIVTRKPGLNMHTELAHAIVYILNIQTTVTVIMITLQIFHLHKYT